MNVSFSDAGVSCWRWCSLRGRCRQEEMWEVGYWVTAWTVVWPLCLHGTQYKQRLFPYTTLISFHIGDGVAYCAVRSNSSHRGNESVLWNYSVFCMLKLFCILYVQVAPFEKITPTLTLANDQLDAQILNTFIIILYMYMFRAVSCSSSGGQIVLIQYLLSSLSVSDRPVHRTVTYWEW